MSRGWTSMKQPVMRIVDCEDWVPRLPNEDEKEYSKRLTDLGWLVSGCYNPGRKLAGVPPERREMSWRPSSGDE